jgi:arylsulfatase
MGAITKVATAFPGMTGKRPQDIAPLAEVLRLNGFNTAAFGKSHETAPWEISPSGPFDRWPTKSRFEKFHGFIDDETNQWAGVAAAGKIGGAMRRASSDRCLCEDISRR